MASDSANIYIYNMKLKINQIYQNLPGAIYPHEPTMLHVELVLS
jgi:hypothetical protein